MNSFLEMAKERFSVRKYDTRPIEKEVLDRILEAGRIAPTAVNYQPQRIFVIQSPEAMELLKTQTPYTFNAPVVLMICANLEEASMVNDGHNCGVDDAVIVTTSMMYAAWDEGVGSCWVRGFYDEKLAKAFNLPEDIVPVALLPIGYPAADAVPAKGYHDKRKPMEETVKYL